MALTRPDASQIRFGNRTAADRLRDTLSARDWAVGDGTTNVTAQLQAALLAAVAAGRKLKLEDEDTYLVTRLTIPAGAKIIGKGTLRFDGATATANDHQLIIMDNVSIDTLRWRSPGTEGNNFPIVVEGSNVTIGSVDMASDVERPNEGFWIKGSNVTVGNIRTRNIVRPVAVYNYTNGVGVEQTNIRLGDIDIETFIRGVTIENVRNLNIGNIRAHIGASGAAMERGHNGLLMASVKNAFIGDIDVRLCGEHAVRIGGAEDGGGNSSGISIGVITGRQTGGCVFKIAPTPPEVASDIVVAGVVGYDVGNGIVGGNKEVVRLTSFDNVHIGYVRAAKRNTWLGAPMGLRINSGTDLVIQDVQLRDVDALFTLNEDSDMGIGDLRRISINSLRGQCTGPTAFSINYGTGSRKIGDVYINNMDIVGWTGTMGGMAVPPASMVGPLVMNGRLGGDVVPNISGAPVSTFLMLDFAYGEKRWTGYNAAALAPYYANAITGKTIDIGSSPSWFGDYCVSNHQNTPGAGTYGGSYTWTRNGSQRRGAAIALKQITEDEKENGVAILVQDAPTAMNESLLEVGVFKHNGVLQLAMLPTYADNAAATAAGLVAGDMYKTAAGEVRIRV